MSDDPQSPEVSAQLVEAIVKQIRPILAGCHPAVVGGVLADLVAIFLAGHPNHIRADILANMNRATLQLVAPNEALIYGGRGHPFNESVQ